MSLRLTRLHAFEPQIESKFSRLQFAEIEKANVLFKYKQNDDGLNQTTSDPRSISRCSLLRLWLDTIMEVLDVGLVGIAIALIWSATGANRSLQASIGFAIFGFISTNYLIPRLAPSFIKIGLFGKDLSKPNKPVIPETIGAVAATSYLFVMFFFIPFLFYKYLVTSTTGGGNREGGFAIGKDETDLFPHDKLAGYLSAILCLESTVLLGIADDLFDIRWRHKFFLPAIAAIPLLIVYYVDFGITHVLVPTNFLQNYFQTSLLELGSLYYVYMGAVAIFCPNSINILAGVNGLEVGQSVVLAIILLINDVCYLLYGELPSRESHLFSACLLFPFLGVSLALLKYNWWPSRVFVGDTYCYFAGMVFAVVGILGHFSKTLLLFFIPQIFNFIYSTPQLFGIIPCPRHRLPKFNNDDGLMYPSHAKFEKPLPSIIVTILRLLNKLYLLDIIEGELEVTKDDKTIKIQTITEANNFTLINLVLVWFGPLREDRLCLTLLIIQFIIGILAIVGRHSIGPWLFGYDNLWIVQ